MSPKTLTRCCGTWKAKPRTGFLDFWGAAPDAIWKLFVLWATSQWAWKGAIDFIAMAEKRGDCPVWHQDFLALDLPAATFDEFFANAVLFHIPFPELPRVLTELQATLKPGGVLFASNPRGPDVENDVPEERYGCYLSWETWRKSWNRWVLWLWSTITDRPASPGTSNLGWPVCGAKNRE